MTSECFNLCFSKKKFIVDFECVSTCYNKYIYTVNAIKKIIEDEGRLCYSDYVTASLGAEKRDRFKDEVFPIGGHPNTLEGAPLKRKFFEAYWYSGFKNGR
jgi:hypothetical protein